MKMEANGSSQQNTGAARTKREELQAACQTAKHPQGIAGISILSKRRERMLLAAMVRRTACRRPMREADFPDYFTIKVFTIRPFETSII